jgi:hypothetical protein
MSCPRSYVTQAIAGRRLPGNLASWRGTEVHHVLAEYAWHCKARQVPADWAAFDTLAATVSNDAADVLLVQRDYMQVDYQHLVFTELTLYLDEDFQPVYEDEPGVVPEGAVYKGTLDAGYRHSEIAFLIEDYKSHPQPFEPDTMQGLLYPVLVMQHKPELEAVTFRLRFVRYRNLTREITWTRSDLPNMMAELRRARARQQSLHDAYDRGDDAILPALPNPMCHYCPLLVNGGCPVADENPYKQAPTDLLFELRWLDERRTQVRTLLKDAEQTGGRAIVVADANGNEMSFGTAPSDSEEYPAKDILAKCSDWAAATNDWPLVDGLLIRSTSIKPKLKAKKRAALAQEIREQGLTRTRTKTQTKLRMRNIGEEQDYANEYGEEE